MRKLQCDGGSHQYRCVQVFDRCWHAQCERCRGDWLMNFGSSYGQPWSAKVCSDLVASGHVLLFGRETFQA